MEELIADKLEFSKLILTKHLITLENHYLSMSKRGQYFTIDAFVAMLVVSTGLILVFAVSSYNPSSSQPEVLSQEFINTLAQTKIKEVNNPFLTQQLKANNITDPDNTLLQQAYEFKRYFDSNLDGACAPNCHGYDPVLYTDLSAQFLANVTQKLVPEQYNFEILLDTDVIYGRGTGQDTSDLLVSSKRIVFGTVNKSVHFWGPITAEVRVWQ